MARVSVKQIVREEYRHFRALGYRQAFILSRLSKSMGLKPATLERYLQ